MEGEERKRKEKGRATVREEGIEVKKQEDKEEGCWKWREDKNKVKA